MTNPFRVGGVVRREFFTDRAAELTRIARALEEPQAKLLVYGPRRMGKTSALTAAVERVRRRGGRAILADLSTASSITDIANRILLAATHELGRKWTDVVSELVRRIGVRMTVDADQATGVLRPALHVELRRADLGEQRDALARVLDAIDALARAKGGTIGIVLDEFQEIERFGGKDAEWHLRGVLQHHQHIGYVLSGSDERLIRAMLGKGRAFYKMLEPLPFGPIDPAHLARWIEERMRGAQVRPAHDLGMAIIAAAGPRTRDIVQLSRATYDAARSRGTADAESLGDAFAHVVAEEDAPLRALWELLTPLQQNVLRAAATTVTGLTTRDVRLRFALGDTGTAHNAAKALVARGLLVRAEGGGYVFESPFFRGWVIANALPDMGIVRATHALPDG